MLSVVFRTRCYAAWTAESTSRHPVSHPGVETTSMPHGVGVREGKRAEVEWRCRKRHDPESYLYSSSHHTQPPSLFLPGRQAVRQAGPCEASLPDSPSPPQPFTTPTSLSHRQPNSRLSTSLSSQSPPLLSTCPLVHLVSLPLPSPHHHNAHWLHPCLGFGRSPLRCLRFPGKSASMTSTPSTGETQTNLSTS